MEQLDEWQATGPHWLVYSPRPTVWTSAIWGRPTAQEVPGLTAAYERAHQRAPRFRTLVDFRGLEIVDGAAFAALAAYMDERRADYHAQMERAAVVRPAGLVGTIVAGFYEVLEYTVPVGMFTDRVQAFEWIVGDEAAAMDRRMQARLDAISEPDIVRQVRALLGQQPELDVAGVARALALSRRTLQRQLEDAGRSFRWLRTEVRVAYAQKRLLESDDKIIVIAREVGCASAQHLARLFRERVGVSPADWRAQQRESTRAGRGMTRPDDRLVGR